MPRSALEDAGALLAAAAQLQDAAVPAGSERHVAASLVQVEGVLRALDRTCLAAAAALLPRREVRGAVPTSDCGAAAHQATGAHEQQAQILTSLHDAGASLRAAAESCRRARELVESTYGATMPHLREVDPTADAPS